MEKKEVEREYYPKIKSKLEEIFSEIFHDVYFEITADGKFSNKLKSQISDYRNIVFVFLKKGTSPDITGFVNNVRKEHSAKYGILPGFVVAEFKKEKIKLDDIYQIRKYAELLDARYAFLISLDPIPEEIKRLSRTVYSLLSLPGYQRVTLVHWDKESEQIIEFYPQKPFK